MTHPLPSYLDPNNVLTAWGSSAAQLGLQVKMRARTLSPVSNLHVCMAWLVALFVYDSLQYCVLAVNMLG